MTKTTLYLDDSTLFRIQKIARSSERSQSSLIREALGEYLDRVEPPRPKGIGAYRSGRSDISERAEELLDARERPGS